MCEPEMPNNDPNIDPTAWAGDDATPLRSYRLLGWTLVALALVACSIVGFICLWSR